MKMRWIALAGLLLSALAHAQSSGAIGIANDERLVPPAPNREMRAAWVATVYGIDWPATRNNVTSQRSQMNAILDAAAALKMNGLFLQIRSQCDAMYPSTLEPWSYYLTGRMDRAPVPSTYDPLQEWIDGAHQRGIELYAWFNPYRALVQTPGSGDAGYISPNHITNSNPSIIRQYGTQKFIDPGAAAGVTYNRNVIMDVVNRYDLDGVVFDDYFYPYPDGVNTFDDSTTYAAYQAAGGTLSLANWRRKNVNDFVFAVYSDIKGAKPWVKFGIGPFGIWKSGVPSGVVGLSAYDSLYADSKLWINNGWLDFIAPQLYWKISAPQQSYVALMNWWVQQNLQNRHVWISNYTSKLDGTASGWPAQEILDQITATRNQPGATGNVHYSAKALRDNWQSIKSLLMGSTYASDVLIPSSPWLDNVPPSRPNLTVSTTSTGYSFNWSPTGVEPVRWWLVQTYQNGWQTKVYPATTTALNFNRKSAGASFGAFSVSAVDRLGNTSTQASVTLDSSLLGSSSSD